MTGLAGFLRKELLEIRRTWRIWVLPGIVLFFALTGPVLARFTPELLQAIGPQDAGFVIEVPDPTYVHAYQQWTQNLTQIVTFALIIMLGGVVAGERKSGTAVLMLTKPLSRSGFILAKFVAQSALLVSTLLVGAAVTWGVTWAMFGEAPLRPLGAATGVWLVWALMFVALMLLLSAMLGAQAGAAGLGVAVFIMLSIPSAWETAARFSPAGLLGAPGRLVAGQPVYLAWPLLTTFALTALALGGAIVVFNKKEL